MINNKSINIINNKYFYIFEIDNFLNESFYYDLKKNFPKKEQFEKDNFYYFKNGKLSIESESEVYKNLIKNNETLCKFHNLVNEPFFKKIFFYNLYLKILFSRGFDVKHIIKMIRFPKFTNFNLNKKFSHYLTIFNKIKTTIQFSYIENGGMIVPHKDATDKLITLMLYLPDCDDEIIAGTSFWKTKYISQHDDHLDDTIARNSFYLNSREIYKSSFSGNKLVGFIKSSKSWHSVEKFNVKINNYVRKSININFYY